MEHIVLGSSADWAYYNTPANLGPRASPPPIRVKEARIWFESPITHGALRSAGGEVAAAGAIRQ